MDQQRGVRVVQIVEAQSGQANALVDLLKPTQDVAL